MVHSSSVIAILPRGRSRVGLALAAMAVMGACSTADPRRDPRVGEPAAAPPHVPDNTPVPIADLGLSWRDRDGLRGGVHAATDELVVDVKNNASMARTGTLYLVASGLDGQLIRQPLENFEIAPSAEREVRLPIARLPVQSQVSLTFAVVEAEIVRDTNDRVVIPTLPLYYVFGDDYREVVFYDDSGAFALSSRVNVGSVRAADSVGVHNLHDVQGRVLQEDGTWLDAATQRTALGGAGTFRQGLSRGRLIRSDLVRPRSSEVAAEPPAVEGDVLPIFSSVCTNWRVAYIDSGGRGEDFMATPAMHDEPARHTYAEVTNSDTGAIVWEGYLNSNGCVSRSWSEGNYILTQYGDVSSNGRQIVVYQTDPFGEGEDLVYMPVVETAFTIDDFEGPYTIKPTTNIDSIQSVAVAGRILVAQNTLNGLGMPSGIYTIHANEDCNPNDPNPLQWSVGACCKLRWVIEGRGGNDEDACLRVVTGRTPVGVSSRSAYWKFTIAHEFGHLVMNRAMRFPPRTYVDSANLPDSCACRFMDPAWGTDILLENGILDARPSHCMTGREEVDAAELEGFAHAFAGRVFNRTEQTNGTFVYYKPFKPNASPAQTPPSSAINLLSSIFYENTFCPAANAGVEWDWMVFFYKMSTESASNSISFTDLFSIYKRACGNPNAPCSDQSNFITFQVLRAAALAHFGNNPNNARFLRFMSAANASGIVK